MGDHPEEAGHSGMAQPPAAEARVWLGLGTGLVPRLPPQLYTVDSAHMMASMSARKCARSWVVP